MVDEITLQRLGLIRYLYEAAMEESRRPEPFGSISILKFHDSVELFLDLACDKFGIPAKKTAQFKDYWTELERYLQSQSLSEKRSMDRLNDARVSFKHHGNLPHASSIEKFRVNVSDFFQENTPLIFEIVFDEISMVYLIQNKKAKTLLGEASTLIEQGERGDALDKIAMAFAWVISDIKENKFGWRNAKHFFLGKTTPHLSSSDKRDVAPKFAKYVEGLASSVEKLYEATSMFSLGLDYQSYVKFKLLTPPVVRFVGSEEFQIPRSQNQIGQKEMPSIERCRFCYNFVVESAIRLQNFDFTLEI